MNYISLEILIKNFIELYRRISSPILLVRKINLSVNKLVSESEWVNKERIEQIDLFTNYDEKDKINLLKKEQEKKDHDIQNVILNIKNKYGKNAILKGMNLEDGATARDRNKQIGGHHE